MQTIKAIVIPFALVLGLGLGCDADELELAEPNQDLAELDEPAELVDAEAPYTELAELHELTAPPSEGVCGGDWEVKSVPQGCGSCWHTVPDPDRPGNLYKVYKRWCWTGPGCAGCEPWSYIGSTCYDNC